jgi:hypothetical protein
MGQFLRDQRLRSLNLDEAALDKLNDVLVARVAAWNAALNANAGAANPPAPPIGQPAAQAALAIQAQQAAHAAQAAQVARQRAFLYYIIRFDDKGYRFVDFADVKKHYSTANMVERIIFVVESLEHRQSSGMFGTQAELRLDGKDANLCHLQVQADDKGWVDATFAAIADTLGQQRNWSGWARTPWTAAAIQLFGIVVVFIVAVAAAAIMAPHLAVENAFAVSLVFTLLILSNVWTYALGQIARVIDLAFPNLRFERKDKDEHWLVRLLRWAVLSIVAAFALFIGRNLLDFAGSILSAFWK